MISKDIYESLGDKAYAGLGKDPRNYKQPIKTLWLNKWPLRGSYTDSQLEAFGFKKFDGGWKVPQSKFDEFFRTMWLIKKKIPVDYYDFGSSINTDDKVVSKQSTKKLVPKDDEKTTTYIPTSKPPGAHRDKKTQITIRVP